MVQQAEGAHLLPRAGWLSVLACVAAVCAGSWFATAPRRPFGPEEMGSTPGDPQLGRMVFLAASCASCHATPGQPNPLVLGGGMALVTSFGVFRPPNISPDVADGIGSWSAADLANALVAGVSPGGHHYYPAFPYTSYTGIDIQDIKNLYAYLRTLPPVSGRSRQHDLQPLVRIRRLIGIWKLLFFTEGRTAPVKTGDPVFNRGAYLAETLAHCAECHSTRNIFGAIRPETRFAGGPDTEGTGFVPNITSERLGAWTQADISTLLATGETPGHRHAGSSMTDVISNLSQLPQSDRDAIAHYIKSLPARPTPLP
ncbi:c-type cytochrome [Rhizobium sp. GR12]|uniref:c-type cytochrome n=1 Tax=Rhizobium sp. GR12 TaxID=3053925 RepID=UPI003FA7207E